jgi:glycosyltransferase involved in cell wall biosynthesis
MSLARGIATEASAIDVVPDLMLVTQTPAGEMDDRALPFPVVRRPPIAELIRLIRTNDVIHLAGPAMLPMFFAWLFRKKFVIQHHNYQAVCPNGTLVHNPERTVCQNHFLDGHAAECVRCQAAEGGWTRSLRSTLLAYPRLWLSRRASANVTVSDYAAKRLALPASRTIYNGTPRDTSVLPKSPLRRTDRPYVAFVGRLVPDKGVPLLIEAATELAAQECEVDVKIIGDGPERVPLEGLVRFLEMRHVVSFTGFLEGDDLLRATSDALAVVMPSLSEETAGLSAIENMMRGKLVIASDIGGLSEVLGSTGLKFAPGDAGALAQRIREALEDPEMRVRLGAAARERALSMFSMRRMILEHMNVYNQVLRVPKRVARTARLIRVPRIPYRSTRAG